jgi:hypothetical protein
MVLQNSENYEELTEYNMRIHVMNMKKENNNNRITNKDIHNDIPDLVDVDIGVFLLIDMLFQQGKLNEKTYNKINNKYRKNIKG